MTLVAKEIRHLNGADVEQTRRIVDGSPVCEYIIRQRPAEKEAT
jgi:predicted ArsR family transcriptional regulator